MEKEKKDQKKQVYEILLSQFKDARHRTEYLNDKAHNLLGFDGIINSILVALVVLIAKDESTRKLLLSSSYFNCMNAFLILGFFCYIFSTIFALLSFRVMKYKRAPAIDSIEFIQEIHRGSAHLSSEHLSIQIFEATRYTDRVNKKKYDFLIFATIFLLIAIVCTAIIGILVFVSIK